MQAQASAANAIGLHNRTRRARAHTHIRHSITKPTHTHIVLLTLSAFHNWRQLISSALDGVAVVVLAVSRLAHNRNAQCVKIYVAEALR